MCHTQKYVVLINPHQEIISIKYGVRCEIRSFNVQAFIVVLHTIFVPTYYLFHVIIWSFYYCQNAIINLASYKKMTIRDVLNFFFANNQKLFRYCVRVMFDVLHFVFVFEFIFKELINKFQIVLSIYSVIDYIFNK